MSKVEEEAIAQTQTANSPIPNEPTPSGSKPNVTLTVKTAGDVIAPINNAEKVQIVTKLKIIVGISIIVDLGWLFFIAWPIIIMIRPRHNNEEAHGYLYLVMFGSLCQFLRLTVILTSMGLASCFLFGLDNLANNMRKMRGWKVEHIGMFMVLIPEFISYCVIIGIYSWILNITTIMITILTLAFIVIRIFTFYYGLRTFAKLIDLQIAEHRRQFPIVPPFDSTNANSSYSPGYPNASNDYTQQTQASQLPQNQIPKPNAVVVTSTDQPKV